MLASAGQVFSLSLAEFVIWPTVCRCWRQNILKHVPGSSLRAIFDRIARLDAWELSASAHHNTGRASRTTQVAAAPLLASTIMVTTRPNAPLAVPDAPPLRTAAGSGSRNVGGIDPRAGTSQAAKPAQVRRPCREPPGTLRRCLPNGTSPNVDARPSINHYLSTLGHKLIRLGIPCACANTDADYHAAQ